MSKLYKIIPDLKNKNALTIHPDVAQALGISHKVVGYVRFGIKAYEIEICHSDELQTYEILLGKNVCENLKIPLIGRYGIRVKGNEIIFGPYIGILAAKDGERLEKIIDAYSNYLYSYEDIGGAVLVFTLDGINKCDHTIVGYVYNPETATWEKDVYAYPAVLFKRIGMDNHLRNHFKSLLGNRIFNDYIFDKWEMFQWLQRDPCLKVCLPESYLYKKPEDIEWVMKEHGRVVIKPINGSQGFGIMIVEKIANSIVMKINGEEKKEYNFTIADAREYFKQNLISGRYLIQETIDLLTYQDKLIDFRLLLLKNQAQQWEDIGLIARLSSPDSFVTNVSSGGSAELAEDIFRKVLGLAENDVFKFRNKIQNIAITAAKALEAAGICCGNLGMDIAIDKQWKIWIIEINNKDPNHTIALDAGLKQTFYRAKLTNMLYAKTLAGF